MLNCNPNLYLKNKIFACPLSNLTLRVSLSDLNCQRPLSHSVRETHTHLSLISQRSENSSTIQLPCYCFHCNFFYPASHLTTGCDHIRMTLFDKPKTAFEPKLFHTSKFFLLSCDSEKCREKNVYNIWPAMALWNAAYSLPATRPRLTISQF